MTQTKSEKAALTAAWLADSRVRALGAELTATAAAAGWGWNAAGLTAALRAAAAIQRRDGALPVSGVVCE